MNRTAVALRLAFAYLLSVSFEQKIRPLARMKLPGRFGFDNFPRLPIGDGVILALKAVHNAHQNVRTVGRHGGNRSNACKQQDAISSGI